MKKEYNLFLDDDPGRIPNQLSWIELPLVEWTIVRSYNEFVQCIEKNELPVRISFDHDLGPEAYQEFHLMRDERREIDYSRLKEKTGYDAAKYIAHYCIDKGVPIPVYYVHTMNPIGKENIISILESARKIIDENYEKSKCGN